MSPFADGVTAGALTALCRCRPLCLMARAVPGRPRSMVSLRIVPQCERNGSIAGEGNLLAR